MSKRPKSGRGAMRGDSSYVKVSGKLADFLGLKASAGRYIARGALAPVQEAFQLWKDSGDAIDDAATSARDHLRAQSVSNRQRAQHSIRNRTGAVRSREKHAKHIKTEVEAGRRGYSSEAAAKAAAKNKAAIYARKLRARIEDAVRHHERIPEYAGPDAPKPVTKRVRKGRGFLTLRTGFLARNSHAGRVAELRQRKLAGGELDDGDWHMMMDYAEYFKDPERERLRASPGSFTVKAELENE
jgi:hypothetical protein